MRHIGDDGHIGLNAFCNHLSTTQADFLLHRIGDVESEGQFDFLLMQQSRHFSNHESSGAVVQCTCNVPVLVQDHELVIIGDDTSDMNAHGFYFLFVLCADV